FDFELRLNALAADDRRDREADVADAVRPRDERGDRQDALGVEREGVYDLADREADGEPRAPFELDDLGAAAPRPREEGVGGARRPSGELVQREARGLRGGPGGNHAVTVLAEDGCGDLRGRQVEGL